MSNKITIFIGLILFLVLATFPFWYTLGAGRQVEMPELELPQQGQCIEPQMVARHMDLLDQWRNAVVRQGEKHYIATSGEQHVMSLTGTCLGCHQDRQTFCTRCHEYANVLPFRPAADETTPPGIRCWDCHLQPQQDESQDSDLPNGDPPNGDPQDAGPQNNEPKGD